ncbi:putative p21-activated protein kinase-interacting protein 1-like isoform X1 [Iris pallida]|uniref:P21-activated protein kinase-interacting protein 1-like isoform X1 n=1 Tax=Iris pallida TaxID=29817 RepID=A0AAX6IFH1_IRIPA|nr:putative p21-activated protein kinase-interacting protein 1-like isoform X1 [Iris pallida]
MGLLPSPLRNPNPSPSLLLSLPLGPHQVRRLPLPPRRHRLRRRLRPPLRPIPLLRARLPPRSRRPRHLPLLLLLPLAPSHPRNLLSASADGNLCIYDAGDRFVHLKTVPVHRKGVADLAVHPSGRLALTVGRDAGIGMVNLVRGRRSFFGKLDREAKIVRYGDGSGEKFFMVREERISVHESEDARVLVEMDGGRRVLSAAVSENGLLFTGGEDRNVTAWDTTSGKVAYCIEGAHSARVKGLVVFKKRDNDHTSEASNVLASAASDGVIRVWDLRMIAIKDNSNPLAEANTKSRLTCLAGSSSNDENVSLVSPSYCRIGQMKYYILY